MNHKTSSIAFLFKNIAIYGVCSGLIIFLAALFVSDYTLSFIFSALALGITGASIFLFGFGLCLCMMEEAAPADRHISKSFSERMTYLIWR